jgi:hypothetical protein
MNHMVRRKNLQVSVFLTSFANTFHFLIDKAFESDLAILIAGLTINIVVD